MIYRHYQHISYVTCYYLLKIFVYPIFKKLKLCFDSDWNKIIINFTKFEVISYKIIIKIISYK